jgi:hypothetical protein
MLRDTVGALAQAERECPLKQCCDNVDFINGRPIAKSQIASFLTGNHSYKLHPIITIKYRDSTVKFHIA